MRHKWLFVYTAVTWAFGLIVVEKGLIKKFITFHWESIIQIMEQGYLSLKGR